MCDVRTADGGRSMWIVAPGTHTWSTRARRCGVRRKARTEVTFRQLISGAFRWKRLLHSKARRWTCTIAIEEPQLGYTSTGTLMETVADGANEAGCNSVSPRHHVKRLGLRKDPVCQCHPGKRDAKVQLASDRPLASVPLLVVASSFTSDEQRPMKTNDDPRAPSLL